MPRGREAAGGRKMDAVIITNTIPSVKMIHWPRPPCARMQPFADIFTFIFSVHHRSSIMRPISKQVLYKASLYIIMCLYIIFTVTL